VCKLVWFPKVVPKNAFASWLVVKKNKLTTKNWQIGGMQGRIMQIETIKT